MGIPGVAAATLPLLLLRTGRRALPTRLPCAGGPGYPPILQRPHATYRGYGLRDRLHQGPGLALPRSQPRPPTLPVAEDQAWPAGTALSRVPGVWPVHCAAGPPCTPRPLAFGAGVAPRPWGPWGAVRMAEGHGQSEARGAAGPSAAQRRQAESTRKTGPSRQP